MKHNTSVTFRTNKKLKTDAVRVIGQMGLDLSAALNIFLAQVNVQKSIPFSVSAEMKKAKKK